jgi:hypothetical protein
LDYAAIEVVCPFSGRWELMSSGGRVVVFDSAGIAGEVLPLLGGGRRSVLDADGRGVTFAEISLVCPNRARVVSPYVPGEAVPWRRHVIWSEWLGAGGGEQPGRSCADLGESAS